MMYSTYRWDVPGYLYYLSTCTYVGLHLAQQSPTGSIRCGYNVVMVFHCCYSVHYLVWIYSTAVNRAEQPMKMDLPGYGMVWPGWWMDGRRGKTRLCGGTVGKYTGLTTN